MLDVWWKENQMENVFNFRRISIFQNGKWERYLPNFDKRQRSFSSSGRLLRAQLKICGSWDLVPVSEGENCDCPYSQGALLSRPNQPHACQQKHFRELSWRHPSMSNSANPAQPPQQQPAPPSAYVYWLLPFIYQLLFKVISQSAWLWSPLLYTPSYLIPSHLHLSPFYSTPWAAVALATSSS